MKVLKNQNGFTLVESLSALAIFTMVLLILFSLLVFGLNIWRKMEDAIAVRQTARFMVESILLDIRTSERVRAYDKDYIDDSLKNTIEIDIPQNDGAIKTFTYSFQSAEDSMDGVGKIYRNDSLNSRQMALNVENFDIIWNTATMVDINFTLQKGRSKLDFTTSIDLRHKVIK